ncbi:MAG: hypothetical protein AAF349_16215 [Cyanobacteria bacterium P01_A01_bin.68]
MSWFEYWELGIGETRGQGDDRETRGQEDRETRGQGDDGETRR